MKRRKFLAAAGLGGSCALLAACSNGKNGGGIEFPPRSQAMDPGPLRPVKTRVDGLAMHALVAADAAPAGAPAMVLVHGSGLSGRYMIPCARELAADFRVYVPDLPGYGESEDPGELLDVPELADWLSAWLHAMGLERAAFLGNSFGCQVIADLAARYPQDVERALLQGPTTPPQERSAFWQFIRWRQNQRYNPDWLGAVTNEAYEQAGLRRMIHNFLLQITDRIEDKAPLIRAPVLVIRGAHDPITTQEYAELIARLCPRGELLVIPQVAHTLVTVAPVELAEAARAYMKRAV